MLESVNLNNLLLKEEFDSAIKPLRARLSVLQQQIKQAKIPVVMVFEGWGASGKGSLIGELIRNFDPRGFKVFSCVAPTESERRKPLMARYWANIPENGNISVFDRSWYREVSVEPVDNDRPKEEVETLYREINTFERQLADGGYLVLKFFLHISCGEQKKRFQHLEDSPITAWRVTKDDWKHHKNYNRYLEAFDQMLTRTNTPYAPWRVMESEDRRWAAVRASETIIQQMEQALAKRQNSLPAPLAPIDAPEKFQLVEVSPLGAVEPARDFDESLYKETLKQLQKQLSRLHNKLYLRKIPVVIVYEGWDAAGKGGNIKRVTAALDPRGYEVVPIAAPTPDELRHHYLWRFWNQLPKTGHIAIFDRSWYGRVMVERIEGFCSENDWRRAYTEMNEFERTLTQWGAVVIKFWLHIDQEEQLRRFTLRQQTPEKQWKITDEDWRNREKWPQYEVAVNDMLRYTSTDFAPWHIIESNNKKFARIKALKIIIRALEERMRK